MLEHPQLVFFSLLKKNHFTSHEESDINIFNSLEEPSQDGPVGFAETYQPELQEMLQLELQEPWLLYQRQYFHLDDVPLIVVGSAPWSLMLAAMDVACPGTASEQDVEVG